MEDSGLAGRIAERSSLAGVDVDTVMAGALAAYVELLRRWSRRMNLTGLGTDDGGLDRLVVEPLVAARYLPGGAPVVVDVGSGGGSPAVPLKLASPGIGLRMVESKGRKAAFLREVVRQLGLEDVVVEACRYEELAGRAEWQESADIVTVRAVRLNERMLDDLLSLVRVGGALFLFQAAEGGDAWSNLSSSWRRRGRYPLVDSLGSQLIILDKSL
ncbi:MAG: hypothetical protein CL477_04380 [Acidobacteria bacterium]|jgi:16S rRNA (guanine527-N7)-methyltransferase|nr:hypothetical protein [Acidobacteriota bacterium]HCV22483.1 hypothetical protein [Candidatus Latescibacterota bacterium]HJN44347.1 RsmG family class I SAM-dependent methyltransferase [Vicinamibacterales bacterium]|tara:strand:- start:15131 stop:15775 length:645 start_codon:yes stop_codon:yes gene_type:complete